MRQLVRRRLTWFTTPGLVIAFGVIWHLYIVIFDVSDYILPKPLEVVASYVELLGDSRLWEATGVRHRWRVPRRPIGPWLPDHRLSERL